MQPLSDLLNSILASTTMDEALVSYLKSSALAQFVVTTPWAWPLAETLHFLGLALLLGCIGPLDFRLLGFMRQVPISAFRALVPWAVAGFVVNLVTGVIFLIAAPDQYLANLSWWPKVFFILLAGLNVLLFEVTQKSKADRVPPGQDTPPVFKMMGGVSIVSWFMVLFWGRMLAFIGNAF
jgi:hypothetical protein